MSDHSADGIEAGLRFLTRLESAAVGLRLAASVAARFGIDVDGGDPTRPAAASLRPDADAGGHEPAELRRGLLPARRFAFQFALRFCIRLDNQKQWREEISRRRAGEPSHPLSRIAAISPLAEQGDLMVDLVLLASLPELHEGYATLFRLLHPHGLPYATVTLALNWLEHEAGCDPAATTDRADALGRSLALRDTVEGLLLHSAFGV